MRSSRTERAACSSTLATERHSRRRSLLSCATMRSRGVSARTRATRSDTEVIVHLYEEHGEDFVAALDGMFALALWDERRQKLVLARDRFGKKPLLYADSGDRLSAASEFSALLVDPAVSTDLDRD